MTEAGQRQQAYDNEEKGEMSYVKRTAERVCPVCGMSFKPKHGCQVYCSHDCQNARFNAWRREQAANAAKTRKPKVHAKVCAFCGAAFETKNPKRMYCSRRCSHNAWRRNNPEAYAVQKERTKERERKRYRVKAAVERLAREKLAKETEAKRRAEHRAKLWAEIHKPLRDDEPLGRWL